MMLFEGNQEVLTYILDNEVEQIFRVWEILDIVNLSAMRGRDLL